MKSNKMTLSRLKNFKKTMLEFENNNFNCSTVLDTIRLLKDTEYQQDLTHKQFCGLLEIPLDVLNYVKEDVKESSYYRQKFLGATLNNSAPNILKGQSQWPEELKIEIQEILENIESKEGIYRAIQFIVQHKEDYSVDIDFGLRILEVFIGESIIENEEELLSNGRLYAKVIRETLEL